MKSIFHSGGALPFNHSTYVERRADDEAFRAILNGEYIHVIAPRQVGKTSLLKRLAVRLNEMGWRCAYLDLATFMGFTKPTWYAEFGKELGRSLTPGDVPKLGSQLDLRRYLLDQALSWSGAQSYIEVFLDEVEGVTKAHDENGQPFSDTFFMVLRNLYNQRDDYEGTLVVALAGAVNPNDLVQDPNISPFNIGQEISLDDFTTTETQTLTQHLTNLDLPVDTSIHGTIYKWTYGHPYLTQRICAELEKKARNGSLMAITSEEVTTVVERTLLNPTNPLQQDSNLRHVGKMLNQLSAPAARLWSRLRAGERVMRQEAVGDLYLELYLTGTVKAEREYLVIRNRIYERAFTAEKRESTQRAAVTPKSRSTTMSKLFRVFISSTWVDLQLEREAVEKALHRMQSTTFSGMEYFGSRPETPKDVSLNEVDRSEVYIGVFAHRYGSGITEAEYRRARELGIPCLIYIKDDNTPVIPAYMEREPEKASKLEDLKRELKKNHAVSFFSTPDNLATQTITDIHNLLNSMPDIEKVESPVGTKYNINITDGQGIVIGDQAQVTQHFGGSSEHNDHEGATARPVGSDNATIDELYQMLHDRFDLEELRTLCFYLDVEFDDLRGEGRAAKARELVKLMQRRDQLDRLQTTIQQLRGR